MNWRRLSRKILFAVGLVVAATAFAQGNARLPTVKLNAGIHVITAEVAANDATRSRGLMFRKELPDAQGMLFDFKVEQEVGFWMKNTYIPLDMIFIRADGTIRRIAANTEPLSERLVPSGGPIRFVLEVAGGSAKKLGIEPGDKVTGTPLR